MTYSRGPWLEFEPWVAAVRTQPLYVRHMLFQLSYWGVPWALFDILSVCNIAESNSLVKSSHSKLCSQTPPPSTAFIRLLLCAHKLLSNLFSMFFPEGQHRFSRLLCDSSERFDLKIPQQFRKPLVTSLSLLFFLLALAIIFTIFYNYRSCHHSHPPLMSNKIQPDNKPQRISVDHTVTVVKILLSQRHT